MSTEITIRLGFFVGIFFLVAICEILAPRRALTTSKTSRWFANLAIIALNPLSIRLFFPVLPTTMAILATERQWGLLNNVDLPYWLEVAIGVVALDFSICSMFSITRCQPCGVCTWCTTLISIMT